MPYFKFQNKEIEYNLKKSSRARRYRIMVDKGEVKVTIPRNGNEKSAIRFVRQNLNWIHRKITESRENISAKHLPDNFVNGEHISYLGNKVPLNITKAGEIIPYIEYNNHLNILLPHHIAEENRIREIVTGWLKKQAHNLAVHYTAKFSQTSGLIPRKIRIKEQKRRWGSCGINNEINFNWQLIFYPQEIFEYVVAHELCHIKYRDHSGKFWQMVESLLPDYRERRSWLRKNGVIIE